MTTQAVDEEEMLVHTWRVARLTQLGIPRAVAEVEADRLDWHQVARLVQHGCPPRLAPAYRPLMSGPVKWPVRDERPWLPATDSPCFPDRRRRRSTANSRGLRPAPCAVRLTSVRAPARGGSLSSLTVRGPAGALVKAPNTRRRSSWDLSVNSPAL